jgi:hypothetical protein
MNSRGISLVFIVGLLAVGLSCNKKRPPEGILSKKDMVNVLKEIYIAEDKVQRMGVRFDSANRVMVLMTDKIAARTGVSDSVFRNSMRYYMDRPKEMEAIYTVLVDSLNLMEQRSSFGNEPE